MRPAMISGIAAGDAPVSYWPIGPLHDLITHQFLVDTKTVRL